MPIGRAFRLTTPRGSCLRRRGPPQTLTPFWNVADLGSVKDLAQKAQQRVGQVFAKKWSIDRLLDIGGMASVFAATHRNGNRVAIKVLHSTFAQDGDVKQRFLEEGYVANKV